MQVRSGRVMVGAPLKSISSDFFRALLSRVKRSQPRAEIVGRGGASSR